MQHDPASLVKMKITMATVGTARVEQNTGGIPGTSQLDLAGELLSAPRCLFGLFLLAAPGGSLGVFPEGKRGWGNAKVVWQAHAQLSCGDDAQQTIVMYSVQGDEPELFREGQMEGISLAAEAPGVAGDACAYLSSKAALEFLMVRGESGKLDGLVQ